MWKRGGRSSALERAQALLSAKRSSRGDAVPVPGSTVQTAAVGGSVKNRPSFPNTHLLFSDLSDLSSVSSAPEHGADTLGSAVWTTQGREDPSTKDLRPQNSLGGGGSRFLKKAPPPATTSSQSPVNKRQMHQAPEYRNVSSSQRSSQTAALSRLAQIESRIRSRKQVQEPLIRDPRPAENLTSDVGNQPPPPVAQFLEEHLSAETSSDQSLKGKRFLKNKTGVAVNTTNTAAAAAARCSEGADVGVGSRSAAVVASSTGLEAKSVRLMSGVSLESDEEDMRKLLGDSLDSTDNSFLIRGRPSSMRTADKMNKSSQKVHSSSPPAPVPPPSSSNTAPPRSPASPHRSSPFRFAGHAQAHFSPSALSPSPSPPGRLSSSHRLGSPQHSLSSMSGRGEVLSLEELFSAGPGSEDLHSEMSTATSEDFKINVMMLDDLVPATLGFSEQTPRKEREVKLVTPPCSPTSHRSQLKEEKKEEQGEEGALDYQSDFESESRTESDYSISQVSEHLQEEEDEEEVVSEVREEASHSDVSRGRTEDDYSSTFSDASRSSWTSGRSQTPSRSRSSVSHGSQTSSPQSRRRASTRKVLREAAVQTQPDPLAYTRPVGALGPAVGMTYMDPTPVAAHILSAETVEALSTFNPAGFALNEMLKQQLAITRRFIESSRHLHSSLVQSLGPPNYRYTTLEDTKEYIRKHRAPTLTMKEALEEVQQEMRDCHHT